MADIDEAFATLLREYIKEHIPKALTVGTAINITDDSCDVQFENEADLLDVKLHAVIDDSLDSILIIKPKENSKVAVGYLDNTKKEAVIVQCSEIDEFIIKNNTVQFKINETGVLVQKGDDNLKDALNDIIAAMQQIMVMYGNNPAFDKLTEAKNKINNILR